MVGNQNREHTSYFNVSHGKVCARSTSDNPQAQKKVNAKTGEEYYLLEYDFIEGVITGVNLKKTTIPGTNNEIEKLAITGKSPEGKWQLEIMFPSRYADGFFKRIDAVNLGEKVRIAVGIFKDRDTGKENPYLIMYQNGEKIEPYYTREGEHQWPELKKVVFQGKEQWDSTDILKLIRETILPRIQKKIEATPAPNSLVAPRDENATVINPQGDDLPF